MAKLTERQKELRKKYTRITQIGGEYVAYLQIDHQGFNVTYDTTNKKHAEWSRDMLAIALDRMISSEIKMAPVSGSHPA